MKPQPFDCLDCGACCKAFGIYEVCPSDPTPKHLTVPTELGYARMKVIDFTCIALNHDNCCNIYDDRPSACRKLVPGGDLCLMARKQMGIPPKPQSSPHQ
jgi:Fe-S-cluster containining protein